MRNTFRIRSISYWDVRKRKTDFGIGFEDKTETDANFKTEQIRFSKYNDIIIGFTIKQL